MLGDERLYAFTGGRPPTLAAWGDRHGVAGPGLAAEAAEELVAWLEAGGSPPMCTPTITPRLRWLPGRDWRRLESCTTASGSGAGRPLELHPQVVDVDAGTAEARILHQREEW